MSRSVGKAGRVLVRGKYVSFGVPWSAFDHLSLAKRIIWECELLLVQVHWQEDNDETILSVAQREQLKQDDKCPPTSNVDICRRFILDCKRKTEIYKEVVQSDWRVFIYKDFT